MISEQDMYLFNEGTNYYAQRMLGAHMETRDGKTGFRFSVWAPNAQTVSVVGDFNGWDRNQGSMDFIRTFGIWETFIEKVEPMQNYKFSIEDKKGEIKLKSDPFAFYSELRPANASVTIDMTYKWGDGKWYAKRKTKPVYETPINIYEVHFGSWKRHDDGSFLTYAEMADQLIPYVVEMGYTHIELMPICEFPFDGSWGYQVIGYYAANSRFGTPRDLKYFIDKCHQAGIGVICDWVPAHFPKDEHGLSKFDGTCLYESEDKRIGEHLEWGTLIFNWKRAEVVSFLISNALFWIEEYHFDGLRVDAVSSMLYLDYNRREGEWLPNKYGGKENLEAIDFLRKLNIAVFERFPETLMIAEESTSWGGVTKPVHKGGLGFNYKWNMGFMNDMLRYMSMDPYFRKFNHDILTFSMLYAFTENFILAFSHDEVVHGKRSMIDKMYGSYEEKFAGLRLLYAYTIAHPGKKLLFMGDEFAQFIEWRFNEGLDWGILEFELHQKMQNFIKKLNNIYSRYPSLYENDGGWDGFRWINPDDNEKSTVSFIRINKEKTDKLIIVSNFTPVKYEKYLIGVPEEGNYEVILNTDEKEFGGAGNVGRNVYKSRKEKFREFEDVLDINVPPLSSVYLRKCEEASAESESKKIKTKR